MEQISYNTPAVADFATGVGNRSNNLGEIHHDVTAKTQALAEFFAGHGAEGFFSAQQQMLSGLSGLIQTMASHGTTTNHVLDGAIATDQAISNLF